MTPKISVVVPIFNAKPYLERCIHALKAQTLNDIEILLLDDSSTDGSLELCQALTKDDERFMVLSHANQGAGFTRNLGINLAKGDYIAFVDADDAIAPTYLEEKYAFTEGGTVDIVTGGNTDVVGEEQTPYPHLLSGQCFNHDGIVDKLLPTTVGYDEHAQGYAGMSVWRAIFRRAFLVDNNLYFFSERDYISEDAIFSIDVYAKAKRACVSRGVGYFYHRYVQGSLSSNMDHKRPKKYAQSMLFQLERLEKNGILTPKLRARVQSMYIANMRVLCMNVSKYSLGKANRDVKAILSENTLKDVLKNFNYGSYPLKLKVFTFCMHKGLSLPIVLFCKAQACLKKLKHQ